MGSYHLMGPFGVAVVVEVSVFLNTLGWMQLLKATLNRVESQRRLKAAFFISVVKCGKLLHVCELVRPLPFHLPPL